MTETQAMLQQQDVNAMWLIFAVLACILPIYYGFKKNVKSGMLNTSIVSGALFLYFTVPAAKTIITIGFILFILVGLVQGIKENVF